MKEIVDMLAKTPKNHYGKKKKHIYYAFYCAHHVNTLMKEIVDMLPKTPKNHYGKKKKHIYWVTITIKSFFPLVMVMIKSFVHLSY